MADERDLLQRAARGERARQILDDPLVQEAFEKLERAVVLEWMASGEADHRARHNAWLMVRLLCRFQDHFKALVATGRAAALNLKSIEKNEEEKP